MDNMQLGAGFDSRENKSPSLQYNQHSKMRGVATVKLLIVAIHYLLFLSNELRGPEAFINGCLLSR